MAENQNWDALIEQSSGDIRRMTSVWRYSSIPISVPENVADHSYFVALYAGMIHQAIYPNNFELLGPILLHALTHDLPECVTGDVVRVFKYTTPQLKTEIDKAEHILANKLPGHIRKIVELDLVWMCGGKSGTEASERRSYVETIVKAADFLSLFQFMRREAMRGNLEIIPFFNRFLDDLEEMAKSHPVQNFIPTDFYMGLWKAAMKIGSECFANIEKWSQRRNPTL